MSTPQSESELDSLANLEERIRRAVELVATLKAERDAALSDLAEARVAMAELAPLKKAAAEAERLREESTDCERSASRFAYASKNCWGRWIN